MDSMTFIDLESNLILDGEHFFDELLTNYYSYSFLTTVDITNPADNILAFGNIFNRWRSRHEYGFLRMWDAIRAEYNPIENYDRHEEHVFGTVTNVFGNRKSEHKEDQKSDSVTLGDVTTTSNIDERNVSNVYGQRKNTTDYGKEKTETTEPKTKDVVTNYENTMESSSYIPNGKTETEHKALSDSDNLKTTTENDSHTVTSTDNAYTDSVTNDAYVDVVTVSHDTADTTLYGQVHHTDTTDSYTDTVNTHTDNLHMHGNIGTTRNSEMVIDELSLRVKSVQNIIIENFANECLFYYDWE